MFPAVIVLCFPLALPLCVYNLLLSSPLFSLSVYACISVCLFVCFSLSHSDTLSLYFLGHSACVSLTHLYLFLSLFHSDNRCLFCVRMVSLAHLTLTLSSHTLSLTHTMSLFLVPTHLPILSAIKPWRLRTHQFVLMGNVGLACSFFVILCCCQGLPLGLFVECLKPTQSSCFSPLLPSLVYVPIDS